MIVCVFVVIRRKVALGEAVGKDPMDGRYGIISRVLGNWILLAVYGNLSARNSVGSSINRHCLSILNVLGGTLEIKHITKVHPCAVAYHMDIMTGLLGIGHCAGDRICCSQRKPGLHILGTGLSVESPVADIVVLGSVNGHFGRFNKGILIAADLVVAGNVGRGVAIGHTYSHVSHKVDTGGTRRHRALKEFSALAVDAVVNKCLFCAYKGSLAPAKVDSFLGEAHKVEGLDKVGGIFITTHHAGLGGECNFLSGEVKAQAYGHFRLIKA